MIEFTYFPVFYIKFFAKPRSRWVLYLVIHDIPSLNRSAINYLKQIPRQLDVAISHFPCIRTWDNLIEDKLKQTIKLNF